MEEKYFKDLDHKLDKLKESRDHIKGKKVDKSHIITGVKKMKLTKDGKIDRTRSVTR